MTNPTNNSEINSVPLLDVCRGNAPLRDEFMNVIGDIIDSGRFIGGPHCQDLEQAVAQKCETQFAVGCASGSDALLLALMAIGIEEGDEVILPSFTFFATASAVTRLGAKPVFVDINPESFNLDPVLLEDSITSKTRAIIPVHLFGQCCEMHAVMDIARRHGLRVIEDCAQSIGATYNEKPAGSMGDIGCFSFYPTKNLGGFGDGGMLTTNDAELADRLRLLANHGMRPRYYHQEIGINSRLDSIQAAILNIKLKHVDEYGQKRQANAMRYQKLMVESGLADEVVLPSSSANCCHVWNQYTIRVPNGWRDSVRQQLSDMNIGTEIYYPIPCHQQVCFSHLRFGAKPLPETDRASTEVLSLPIFPELTREEQRMVVQSLAHVMRARSSEYRKAA